MTGRVLFITGEYPPMVGGIGDYTTHLAQALEDSGWEALVMTSSRAGNGADERVVATVNRWDSRILGTLQETIANVAPDLIHIQYQTGAYQMRPSINLLPMRLGIRRRTLPVVTTFHDLLIPYLFPKAGHLRRWTNRLLGHGSDAIILTNERDYRQVRRIRRLRDRTRLIPLGSNIPVAGQVDRDTVLRTYDLPVSGFIVGFFGFLTADKGIDDLLDALERPDMDGAELLIIGGGLATTDTINRRYHDRIQQRFEDTSVPVHQIGHLPPHEVADVLAAVDLIVLPFRRGASLRSGTLLAALQSGTPVITTDPRSGDSLAPFAPGESLWLVPASETDFLYEAIQLLRHEPSLRNRLGRAAQEAARSFSWDSIVEKHIAVYEQVMSR